MKVTQQLYESYKTKMRRIADIKAASAVLQWDQETYLPPGGASFRGQQISTLSELAHELFSEDSFGNLLRELKAKADLTAAQSRNVGHNQIAPGLQRFLHHLNRHVKRTQNTFAFPSPFTGNQPCVVVIFLQFRCSKRFNGT